MPKSNVTMLLMRWVITTQQPHVGMMMLKSCHSGGSSQGITRGIGILVATGELPSIKCLDSFICYISSPLYLGRVLHTIQKARPVQNAKQQN